MFKYNLGLVILSVIIFWVPPTAIAGPDRPQIQHSPVMVAEDYVCHAANIGLEQRSIKITIINEDGSINAESTQGATPGETVFLVSLGTISLHRCTVEWVGQPDDVLGSMCGFLQETGTTNIVASNCLPMQ